MSRGPLVFVFMIAGATLAQACQAQVAAPASAGIDAAALAMDVSVLAADSMEGRRAGTEGGARARAYLLQRLAAIGLTPVAADYALPFDLPDGGRGVNLAGAVRGTRVPDRWILVSAHYDHLGNRGGTIFNGADDNASGVAGVLALAAWFRANPPEHSMLFVLFDAEEMGLRGASEFVAAPPVPADHIRIVVNLDMIGRNDDGELYVAGTAHYPRLEPIVDGVATDAPVTLLQGHDRPGARPSDDWTYASDHGPFHRVGIPFLYFGVEDHADYHRPSDDVERIQPDFHARAVETVRRTLSALDRTDAPFRNP